MLCPYSFLLSIMLMIGTIWLWTEPHMAVADAMNKGDGDCAHHCGDIAIPYPFGVGTGPNCAYNEFFIVTCNQSSSSSFSFLPVLKELKLEILNVSATNTHSFSYGTVIVKTPSATACGGDSNSNVTEAWWNSPNMTGSVFSVNYHDNIFFSVGCNGYAALYDETGEFITGCSSVCTANPPLKGLNESNCQGYRCCQREFPFNSFKSYTVGVSINNRSVNCTSAYLISKAYLDTNYASLLASPMNSVPVELHFWMKKPETKHRVDLSPVSSSLIYFGVLIVGTLILTCTCFWVCWLYRTKRRRKEIKFRAKYFKKRLEEQRTAEKEAVENTKLFTIRELRKATDNFRKDCVLGQGGQGTVYKGMLADGHIVAVKRSTTFNESQWKEFINEVILLSQIKHRHVVKLLGCCLDTKQPLVVYEFIPNGTVFEHIHNSTNEFSLTWEMRLRIAAECANAISYLHSECPTAIYHRDVKSSNILLDDEYMAKLSDFGISKAISVDQTHLTTCIQGTIGYLDPEYFWTSHFSEKSDVYSFGVVLVELLTGQKPIRLPTLEDNEGREEKSLVEYFISSMKNSTSYNILDPIVMKSNVKEEITKVACLAMQCLNPRGTLRPTMKEVAIVLEGLRCQHSSHTLPIELNNELNDKEIESGIVTVAWK